MKFIICTIHGWNIKEARALRKRLSHDKVLLITDKKDLLLSRVSRFDPQYIFFPHWSWKIPPALYRNYRCIGFHMTDLPFGRGGSPLQNLIVRRYTKTKMCAFQITGKLDAGKIYMKRPLSLKGTAREIFEKSAKGVFLDMIPYILKKNPLPMAQKGKIVTFQRRSPQESDISRLKSSEEIFNHIRMLDAPGYPHAYLKANNIVMEFTEAKKRGNLVFAQAKIEVKK